MFESTWGTTTFGRTGYLRGSIIQRISSENLGNSRENHKEQDNKNVKGSVRHSVDEATWEREEDLRTDYPNLFEPSESRGRDSS